MQGLKFDPWLAEQRDCMQAAEASPTIIFMTCVHWCCDGIASSGDRYVAMSEASV